MKFPHISHREQQLPGKLRVLVAGPLPPPLGGIATYFQDLLSSSLPERVELKFVQTSAKDRELAQSGRATLTNLYYALKDWVRFFRAVVSSQPQICHIATAFGNSFIKNGIFVVIARIFRRRILLHPRCSLSAVYSDCPGWRRWMFRRVVRMTDGVIGLSSEWNQLPKIVPGSKVFILHNAINLAPYLSIARDRLQKPTRDGVINILYLGYLGHAKGSFDLLDAAKSFLSEGIEASFSLVGGELRPGELDQLWKHLDQTNLEGTVIIHSPVVGEAKFAQFRSADIFIFPSHTEGLPMAVIEAMASGLPIIATRVGGLPDLVIEGVNGILVDPGRPDQLVAALLTLASDESLRRSMGEKSLQLAKEKFDIEQHVAQLVGIYNRVLSNSALG
jgi:glycosyltransferase involved in cell wall biosynthesis